MLLLVQDWSKLLLPSQHPTLLLLRYAYSSEFTFEFADSHACAIHGVCGRASGG